MHMRARRDGEDVIEFLERPLFGLGNPEKDHDEGGDVEESVKTECALRFQRGEHLRECDGEGGGPEEAGGDGPGHADFAVGKREDFGRVGEWHRTLAGRVKCGEEEDEEGDHAEVGSALLGDPEAEAGGEEGPCHLGEGEEEERAAAVRVDRPHRGPGEDEVDEAETPGGEKSFQVAGAGILEDRRGVEGDNVDAAHLLSDHYGP